jgi:hypothetical protein
MDLPANTCAAQFIFPERNLGYLTHDLIKHVIEAKTPSIPHLANYC